MNRKEFIENVYYLLGLKEQQAPQGTWILKGVPISERILLQNKIEAEINILADKLGVKDVD